MTLTFILRNERQQVNSFGLNSSDKHRNGFDLCHYIFQITGLTKFIDQARNSCDLSLSNSLLQIPVPQQPTSM